MGIILDRILSIFYNVRIMSKKPGRNDPCPCGSGKKYKQCCLLKETAKTYTPSGKRKFKAKWLSGESAIKPIAQQNTFPKTQRSFEVEGDVKPEEKNEEIQAPKFKKVPSKRPGDEFKKTDQDFEVDKK